MTERKNRDLGRRFGTGLKRGPLRPPFMIRHAVEALKILEGVLFQGDDLIGPCGLCLVAEGLLRMNQKTDNGVP